MEAIIGTKEEEEIASIIDKLVSKLVRESAKLNNKWMAERKVQKIRCFSFSRILSIYNYALFYIYAQEKL